MNLLYLEGIYYATPDGDKYVIPSGMRPDFETIRKACVEKDDWTEFKEKFGDYNKGKQF